MDYRLYYAVSKYLRLHLLKGIPVVIRRVRMVDDGDCRFSGGVFRIRVNRDLPEPSAIDTLIHEASHVLSWGKGRDVHGPQWGICYSTVYRKYLEWHAEYCA